jgi:hypothetical protein
LRAHPRSGLRRKPVPRKPQARTRSNAEHERRGAKRGSWAQSSGLARGGHVSCHAGPCLARHKGAGHARQHKPPGGVLRLSGARARRPRSTFRAFGRISAQACETMGETCAPG